MKIYRIAGSIEFPPTTKQEIFEWFPSTYIREIFRGLQNHDPDFATNMVRIVRDKLQIKNIDIDWRNSKLFTINMDGSKYKQLLEKHMAPRKMVFYPNGDPETTYSIGTQYIGGYKYQKCIITISGEKTLSGSYFTIYMGEPHILLNIKYVWHNTYPELSKVLRDYYTDGKLWQDTIETHDFINKIIENYFVDRSTLIHEMGHWFSTFMKENTKKGIGKQFGNPSKNISNNRVELLRQEDAFDKNQKSEEQHELLDVEFYQFIAEGIDLIQNTVPSEQKDLLVEYVGIKETLRTRDDLLALKKHNYEKWKKIVKEIYKSIS